MSTRAKEVKEKKLKEKIQKGSKKYRVKSVNRCPICGRGRSYMRYFNMCRICFREAAHKGELPGVVKASW